jgi:hypothetical protein
LTKADAVPYFERVLSVAETHAEMYEFGYTQVKKVHLTIDWNPPQSLLDSGANLLSSQLMCQ